MIPNTAQRLALNLDSHIVIDAGAGTGKTKTIVDRVIEHYLSGDQRATRILPVPERPLPISRGTLLAPSAETVDPKDHPGLLPGEVVLLTFTNKAADEMRHRLREEISKLKTGSSSISGRADPRVNSSLSEQLLTLLEDAPIGTIDSFFNQLVSPFRGLLGDALSRENISDASRILLIEDALDILWRLPSSIIGVGDAVDAGIPSEIALDVLEARERIARRYSGRKTAARLLSGLVKKSVFIDEGLGPITDDSGSVNPILLKERIFSSADNLQIDTIYTKLKEISVRYCDTILSSPEMVGSGIQDDSRMACLISLCNDSPTTHEGKLIWLAHHLDCTSSYTSVQSESPTIFPRDNLPNDSLWNRGVNSWSSIKDKKFKESTKNSLISQIELIRHTWESAEGSLILHFAQVAMLIDPNPIRNSPESRKKPLIPMPENIPDRAPSGERSDKFYFPLESEARNLEDLRLVHLGF
ncbi:MAG: UvrD-helicase domain-containing protein [Candidatus Thermoplasmatota archaeon]|nr:UvrD-helicase domain-containing protein [Candidatus Thermoplasmatota archaeon]